MNIVSVETPGPMTAPLIHALSAFSSPSAPAKLTGLKLQKQEPFGLLVESETPRSVAELPTMLIHEWMREHRLLILRGFEPLVDDAFPTWCTGMGELLDWEFGTVNTLEVNPKKKNYLYTEGPVPVHWDGAFLHTPPHYIVFQCDEAGPGCGGETTFVNTVELMKGISEEELAAWDEYTVTYLTKKVVHYGGDFMASIIGEHPVTKERTLRYAEPVELLNPVKVFIHGMPVDEHSGFIETMKERLYDPSVLYAHRWVEGDIVLADNHALLHGRYALNNSNRRIRRVNVMTADFDEQGRWIPPEGAASIQGVKAPSLHSKIVKHGQGLLDFKRGADVSGFPQDFSDYIRSHGETYHWPAGGFHVVTRAADARQILRSKHFTANRATFFVAKMPNVDLDLIGDFFGVVSRMMVMSDAKVHGMRRKSALFGITPELIDSFTPRIAQTVDALLDPLERDGSMEFVTALARVLPSTVLADMFMIPEADREFFRKCANTMTGFFGGSVEYTNEVAVECNEATIAIREYFRGLLEDRRRNPQNDFMTGMLEAQQKYNLRDDEVISQAAMMLVAGQVTSTDQICNNLFLMLDTPGVYARLVADPERIPGAQEEFKRWDPAVNFLFRVAKERQIINGQRIDAGDTVFMSAHVLNRDPDEVEDPDVIRIDREGVKHFAYGFGPHYCIGARLGRVQMDLLFRAMVRRFPKLRFTPGTTPVRDHYSLAFSGFTSIELSR